MLEGGFSQMLRGADALSCGQTYASAGGGWSRGCTINYSLQIQRCRRATICCWMWHSRVPEGESARWAGARARPRVRIPLLCTSPNFFATFSTFSLLHFLAFGGHFLYTRSIFTETCLTVMSCECSLSEHPNLPARPYPIPLSLPVVSPKSLSSDFDGRHPPPSPRRYS